jgi:hypothetical protein
MNRRVIVPHARTFALRIAGLPISARNDWYTPRRDARARRSPLNKGRLADLKVQIALVLGFTCSQERLLIARIHAFSSFAALCRPQAAIVGLARDCGPGASGVLPDLSINALILPRICARHVGYRTDWPPSQARSATVSYCSAAHCVLSVVRARLVSLAADLPSH